MSRFSLLLCLAVFAAVALAQKGSRKPSRKGSKVSKNDGKIVGGEWAHISEVPYLVSIQHKNGKHFCGGSIISSRWVLTAAHCLHGVSPASIQIVTGVTDLKWDVPTQTVDARSIIVHSEYDPFTVDNDIALVRLATPLIMNDYVQEILLDSNEFSPPDRVLVCGWGATREDGDTSELLMKAIMPGVTREACQEKYMYISPITNNMICAGYTEGGKDACEGDSGGPAVCVRTKRQVGIVSFGAGCARYDMPGVYTDVSKFKSWINMYTGISY